MAAPGGTPSTAGAPPGAAEAGMMTTFGIPPVATPGLSCAGGAAGTGADVGSGAGSTAGGADGSVGAGGRPDGGGGVTSAVPGCLSRVIVFGRASGAEAAG